MRLVIADDITGGAEIAGLAWEAGLEVEVTTSKMPSASSQMLVVDTHTRGSSPDQAKRTVEGLLDRLGVGPTDQVFKKVDSVLRGNIVLELLGIMNRLGLTRSILAPANPSKDRIIREGRYYIKGQPLHLTEFARDPSHPRTTSSVLDLLDQARQYPVSVGRLRSYNPAQTGIIVAEAQGIDDLLAWAGLLDGRTLAAGGSDFFWAVMSRSLAGPSPPRQAYRPAYCGRWLLVCGSTSELSRRTVAEASQAGLPVCLMPAAGTGTEGMRETAAWADRVCTWLADAGIALAAIPPVDASAPSRADLAKLMAEMVRSVLSHVHVAEIFLEGGTTARAVMDLMGWSRFKVTDQLAPGVVRMAVVGHDAPFVTVKPGSYPWPIWVLRVPTDRYCRHRQGQSGGREEHA